MALGVNIPASQMFNQGIITSVLGDDVKIAGRIGGHGAANVVDEGEIKGVSTTGSETHQLHRGGVSQKFFDQGYIELRLSWSQQQREVCGFAAKDGQVDLGNILKIHEDVIDRRSKMGRGS